MNERDPDARGDYLWDGSGTPDPDVVELERALAPLRLRERVVATSATPASPLPPVRRAPRSRGYAVAGVALAIAASLAIAGGWTLRRRDIEARATPPSPVTVLAAAPSPPSPSSPSSDAWFGVKRIAGAPQCGEQWTAGDCKLHVGQWLETGDDARAEIAIANIGQVQVDPGSRVRLSATGQDQHRLELAKGRIHATVDAPPRLFQVATPAATAVDLGCAYSLEVGDGGDGWLSVRSGYVSLEWKKRTSLVAAGARCEMKRDLGPGTPFFEDARASLKTAIHAFDFEQGGEAAVTTVLREARPRDSLTLWHLLFRSDASYRAKVVARLKALVPPPPGVTDDDAMAPDASRLLPWKEKMAKTW